MFVGTWITRLAPWLIGIGGMLGMTLALTQVSYSQRNNEA